MAAWGGSAEAGLSSEAAGEKLAAFGPNRFPEAPRRSKLEIFFNQLTSLPVALLGVAAGISVLTGAIVDAVAIMTVVAINSSIGFVTEDKAERTISSLKTLMHPSAVVIRDGARKRIDARNLVPGDLMIFEPGTYIGADCRLLEAARLSVDESSLTGESIPVLKEAEVIEEADIPLADRKNIVYMGTLVTGGQGRGIVVATGRFTEIGKLQAMIGETIAPQTPMERQLNTIGTQLVWLSGAFCGLVFITGVMRRTALALISKTTISLAVAAVPEGLPTVATTTLALGIRKLNAHRVIIRDLEAVETLGEVQTICFDKTGTVTENRMSVMRIFSGNHTTELKQDGFFRGGKKISPQQQPGAFATGQNLHSVWGSKRKRGRSRFIYRKSAARIRCQCRSQHSGGERALSENQDQIPHRRPPFHVHRPYRRDYRKVSGFKGKPGGSSRHVRHATCWGSKAPDRRAGHLANRDRERAHGGRGAPRARICIQIRRRRRGPGRTQRPDMGWAYWYGGPASPWDEGAGSALPPRRDRHHHADGRPEPDRLCNRKSAGPEPGNADRNP